MFLKIQKYLGGYLFMKIKKRDGRLVDFNP